MNQTALAEYDLGEQCKKFLETDVGLYLKGVAEQDVRVCADALLMVDPTDVETIRKIQFKAHTAQNFLTWLDDAISNGRTAGHIILKETTDYEY